MYPYLFKEKQLQFYVNQFIIQLFQYAFLVYFQSFFKYLTQYIILIFKDVYLYSLSGMFQIIHT